MKKRQLQEQDHRISLLVNQSQEHDEQMKQQLKCVEQVRDENIKLKNQAKVERQNENQKQSKSLEIAQLYQKFEDFKREISRLFY